MSMHEDELVTTIGKLCTELGLIWHWCSRSTECRGTRGLPDLVIVGTQVLFAECKSSGYSTTASQDEWLWRLHQAGVRQVVWHPEDLEDGTIERTLRELA
jgi:hypothetical protein